jgi:putative ABC transport system permease protein
MRDVDRITLLSYTRPESPYRREGLSPADYLDMKKQSDVFERLAAFEWWTANLVGKDEPESVQGFFVSADFFPALGVQPVAGRGFLPDEETTGRHRRVVLGHGLWQRRFASDSSIVGHSIDVDGQQYEVVGIAPPGFDFPMGAQIWAPLAFSAEAAVNRRSLYITAIGRLAPGRTLEDAKAQMATVGERLSREHPDTNRGREVRVYTLAEGMMDIGVGPILSMWQASALFVLLIACANVASLLLARAEGRVREIAVRRALGAGPGQLVRQALTEGLLLSMAGAAGGHALAAGFVDVLGSAAPGSIPRMSTVHVDGGVLAFALLVGFVTTGLFSLAPSHAS